ncbi:MAG: MBL fold metallo-hydrolase [Candidatus Heimdallarchaeota archaeon]
MSNNIIKTRSQGYCNPILTILGSGVAIPQEDRNAPGLLLTDKGTQLYFLIDCGSGVLRQIVRSGNHYTQISHLFLSHLHVDHTSDVPALFQAKALYPSPHDLKIFGPQGTYAFCNAIVQNLFPYLEGRTDFKVAEVEEGRIIGGPNWEVTCTKVDHFRIEAVAYRFVIENKAIVYSGDTAPCENLKRLATKADLLVHECSFMDDSPQELLRGHSTPTKVAVLAQACKVKKLCLTHFYPETTNREEEILKIVRAKFNGEVFIAKDLLQITL